MPLDKDSDTYPGKAFEILKTQAWSQGEVAGVTRGGSIVNTWLLLLAGIFPVKPSMLIFSETTPLIRSGRSGNFVQIT